MRTLTFGVELEMTGITGKKAAETAAVYFGTHRVTWAEVMINMPQKTAQDGYDASYTIHRSAERATC